MMIECSPLAVLIREIESRRLVDHKIRQPTHTRKPMDLEGDRPAYQLSVFECGIVAKVYSYAVDESALPFRVTLCARRHCIFVVVPSFDFHAVRWPNVSRILVIILVVIFDPC
jgi:hypothetical protein